VQRIRRLLPRPIPPLGNGVVPQFEFSTHRSTKPPTRKTQAPAKVIQLPTTTLRCLSSRNKWAREAEGFSGTLKRRSLAVSQNQLTAPMKQTITGNLTTVWGIPQFATLCLVEAARCWFRSVAIGHHHDFLKTPNMVAQAASHCRGDSQRLVNSGEIVVYGVDRNHSRVILNFLAESVSQTSEAPHTHSHTQIVAFNVGRADMLGVRIAAHNFQFAADTTRGRIAPRFFVGRCAVNLLQLRVVYPMKIQTEALPGNVSELLSNSPSGCRGTWRGGRGAAAGYLGI